MIWKDKKIKMEKVIREKISKLTEKCIALEKDIFCENGDIKEQYQETVIDKYLELFTEFEKEISTHELEICVDKGKESIKKLYIIYYVLDEWIFGQLNLNIATNPSWKAEAEVRLYMMYLKTFRESLFLLANGFSDCALARTRTLYELGVCISILNKNSDDLAERFCKYCNVQSLKIAKATSLEEKASNIREYIRGFNYEDGYEKENGWARTLFPNIKDKSSVQFHDLAGLTVYKNHHSMYKIACNFVHGSLFSSLESLDSAKDQRGKNFWNTSPSNEGIDEVILFLKSYIIVFVMEYANTLGEKTILEKMLMIFLFGREALGSEN